MSRFEAFRKDTRGHVAMLLSLVLFPVVGLAGLAVDYAGLRHKQGQIQSALDSTAPMLTRYAPKNDAAALERIGTPYFNTLLAHHKIPATALKATKGTDNVALVATGTYDTKFGAIFGVTNDWNFPVRAQASYGTRNIEVALVLDNTGSMAAMNKIGELKKASHALVDILRDVAVRPGQVKISLVPYTTRVNLGTGMRNAPQFTANASGDPFNPAFFQQPTSAWNWDGCVADRNAPYNRNSRPASIATPDSLYPMVQCGGYLAQTMPLTTDFSGLHRRIDQMGADGWTNITLGAQWGLETLTNSQPFNETGTAPNTERFIILLTDGENTVDRWTRTDRFGRVLTDAARMDRDTQGMCDAITERGVPEASKTMKVKLYTVLVIDGNENLLRNCASSPDMFRKVQQANQLEGVFKQIANEIGKVTLTM